jgi:hypothetical protein
MKIIILALLLVGCTKEHPPICWTVTDVKMTSIGNYTVTYVHNSDTLFIKQNTYSGIGSQVCDTPKAPDKNPPVKF